LHSKAIRSGQDVNAPGRNCESGFTLLELILASSVVAIALLSLAASVIYAQTLGLAASETHVAVQAAKGVVEGMRSADFRTLFRSYNDDPDDDPNGPGTAPGATFAIPGLDGPGNNLPGRVTLVLDEVARDEDLNGDGDRLDTEANSTLEREYQLLPVTIDVIWRGNAGRRSVRLFTELSTEFL
jgi:prepilin-type N-terminal cleavage/methylation domain-containing protein